MTTSTKAILPLTTLFTPPYSCLASVYPYTFSTPKSNPTETYSAWILGVPSVTDAAECYPEGFQSFDDSFFYSPAMACPGGEPYSVSIDARDCDRDRSSRYMLPQVSIQAKLAQIDEILADQRSYFDCEYSTTSEWYPLIGCTQHAAKGTYPAPSIQIRWQETDNIKTTATPDSSVSPFSHNSPLPSTFFSSIPLSTPSPSTSPSSAPPLSPTPVNLSGARLSPSAIIGISLGIVIPALLLASALCLLHRKRLRRVPTSRSLKSRDLPGEQHVGELPVLQPQVVELPTAAEIYEKG